MLNSTQLTLSAKEDVLLPEGHPRVGAELEPRLRFKASKGESGKASEKESAKWKGLHMDLAEKRILV